MKRLFKTKAGLDAFVARYGKPGTILHMLVIHEPECSRVRCVCDPGRQWVEVTVGGEEELASAFVAGERATRQWLKDTSN